MLKRRGYLAHPDLDLNKGSSSSDSAFDTGSEEADDGDYKRYDTDQACGDNNNKDNLEPDKKKPWLLYVSFDDDPKAMASVMGALDAEGYLGTLKHLVEVVCVPNTTFSNRSRINYGRIVKMLGPEKIKAGIMNALQEHTRRIFAAGNFSFEILQTCDRNKARSYFSPGVYLHVLYDSNDPTVYGLYIGSGKDVAARINNHYKDRFKTRQCAYYKFWNTNGKNDFWILVGGFKEWRFNTSEDT
jgi:hypothetical protein